MAQFSRSSEEVRRLFDIRQNIEELRNAEGKLVASIRKQYTADFVARCGNFDLLVHITSGNISLTKLEVVE